jgi:GAF domain-containing protein/CheY-like chemotaxis protein
VTGAAGVAAARRALRDLAETAAPGADVSTTLERLARAAAALVPRALVQVWVAGDDGREFRLAVELDGRSRRRTEGTGRAVPSGEGFLGRVTDSAAPIVRASVADADALIGKPAPNGRPVRSCAGVRLARGDRVLGALCVFTDVARAFTPPRLDLLRLFGAQGAAALDAAGLVELASRRLQRLEVLREIQREISRQRDPEALVATISRRAAELLEGDSAGVYLLDDAAGVLRPHAAFNRAAWMLDVTIALGEGVVGATAARAKGLVVNDYGRSPLAVPAFRAVNRAVVTQPLLVGGAVQGVIVVSRDASPRPFTPADLVELGDFAVQASIALENARLLRLASVRAERVTAAAQVGQLLAATRDTDRILDLIAEKCREILRAEAVAFYRLEGERLRFVRGLGPDERVPAAPTLALGEGAEGKAAGERRTIATGDPLRDGALALGPELRACLEGHGPRAVVAVPVLARERPVGVLAVYRAAGSRIPAEDVEFLESLAVHAAVALENARLFAETRRRQETAEALATITQSLTASLDLRTVMVRVAEALRRFLGADGGAIGLVSPDGSLQLATRDGLGADELRHLRVGPGEGVTGWVLEHGQSFFTADYGRDPRLRHAFDDVDRAGIRAVLAVPVRLQDEVVGVLYSFWGRPLEPTDEHLALAADLARAVAVAVANARLYEEARSREAEARALFDVGRLISSTLDPDRVFDRIVGQALELMRVRACGIFRLDADGVLRYARGRGLSAEFVRDLAVHAGDGTSGRAVAEGRPVWSADVLAEAGLVREPGVRRLVEREGYRAVLSVPILRQGEAFGCLATYWWEPHAPTPADVQTLTSLATLAAVAIENARLYDETRRHADRLERLNRVTRAVSASLRLDDVLAEIARAGGTLFDAPLVTLWLADAEARVLVRRAGHGRRELLERLPARFVFGEGVAGRVAAQREPVLDLPVDGDAPIPGRELLAAEGVRTFSGLPILLGGRLLGVLAIGRRGDRPMAGDEEALAQALVGQAAAAIENARLYEAARAHELEATRALEELQRTQDQLVRMEKLRALGEMASGVAHDFNNVLAIILGRVQLLQRRIADPALRRWLGIVEQAALDGAQTVRQIQEFTRVRRDQPALDVDMNQIVRDAVELTRTRWQDEAQSRGVEIRVTVEAAPVPPVAGQPPALREALTNLILNAVDALPRGGEIRVGIGARDDRVEVTVADTGVGMSESVRRRIFEPFFSTKGPGGTGLGLAMVYGIVSRHGGEILVDSAEGTGSTFTIRLPVAADRPAGHGLPARLEPESLRVLVVDDDPVVRETLEEMLRLEGHRVVVADEGAAGLARFQSEPFDVVITDLAMPAMPGWQIAQAVKQARPLVPVVLVTGWAVELSPEQLRANGVDEVLNKPFGIDDVRALVARLRGQGDPSGVGGVSPAVPKEGSP